MNLIFIYGPPATGKLTVAKELKKLTKYSLFHNHHTVDLVGSVFEFGTKIFFDLNAKFRLELFKTAAKEKVKGVIFTCCYAPPQDNKFVRDVKKTVEKYKGKVKFVHLTCDISELKKRIKGESRKKHAKIKNFAKLEKSLKKWRLYEKIPFVKNLEIDNTKKSAKLVAKEIKKHYKL